jgi:hypothetical protein
VGKETTITATIVCGLDCPSTSEAKANHVASLAMAYRDVVDTNETLQTAIMDMIADLLHFADSISDDERDTLNDPGDNESLGESIAGRALEHYLAERDGKEN